MSYYEILGISKSASFDEIKRAYFEKIRNAREQELDLLEKAYRTLANDNERAKYDQKLKTEEKNRRVSDLYTAIDPNMDDYDFVISYNDDGSYGYGYEKNKDDEKPLSLSPSEISRALALLVKDDDEVYLEGTNIVKARDRKAGETKEEYNDYIIKYYSDHFYIPGTNILKPRDRKVMETDEEYNDYLAKYYKIIFADIKEDIKEFDDKGKGQEQPQEKEKQQMLKVESRKKNRKLQKVLEGALFAGSIILATVGVTGLIRSLPKYEKETPPAVTSEVDSVNSTVDDAIDDVVTSIQREEVKNVDIQKVPEEKEIKDHRSTFFMDTDENNIAGNVNNYEEYAKEKLAEFKKLMNEEYEETSDYKNAKIGDKYILDEGNILYTASNNNNIAGRVSEYGEYVIDKIIVLDKNDNVVANSSFEEVDLSRYDASYKKMYHFSKGVTAEDIRNHKIEKDSEKSIGWVFSDGIFSNKKVGNVLDERVKIR